MVPVGMRVHDLVDVLGRWHGFAHLEQHVACEFQVKQRIDQQRLVAVDDQPSVAPAPTAVGLQPGVLAVANFMQAFGELPFHVVCLLVSNTAPPQPMPLQSGQDQIADITHRAQHHDPGVKIAAFE